VTAARVPCESPNTSTTKFLLRFRSISGSGQERALQDRDTGKHMLKTCRTILGADARPDVVTTFRQLLRRPYSIPIRPHTHLYHRPGRPSSLLPHRCFSAVVSTQPSYINPDSTTSEHAKPKERVLLLMSGGVDSSMCAHILHRQGYDVTGLYMHNWNHQEETQDEYEPRPTRSHSHSLTDGNARTQTGAQVRPKACTSDRDWADVQAVCQQIEIPSYRLDFSRQYWNQVFEAMLQEYERGRTPNPDIACNREIKFGELIKWCKENGGLGKDRHTSLSTDSPATLSGWDYLATGHYARVEQDPITGRARLMRSPDSNKDQSYYLSELSESVLRHVIFPLAQYNKSTVKGMAIETGVQQLKDAAMKKESMGVCFVGQRRRFGEFLQEYLKAEPGPVKVNGLDGREIGQHKGLFQYTIGQASGIAFGHQKYVPAGINALNRNNHLGSQCLLLFGLHLGGSY